MFLLLVQYQVQTKVLRDRANLTYEAYNRHGCCSGGLGACPQEDFQILTLCSKILDYFYCVGTGK